MLKEVKHLIEDVSKWTQLADARDSFNDHCSPCSADAVKWCVRGAVEHICGCRNAKILRYLTMAGMELLSPDTKIPGPTIVNDRLGHAATMDRAMEIQEIYNA